MEYIAVSLMDRTKVNTWLLTGEGFYCALFIFLISNVFSIPFYTFNPKSRMLRLEHDPEQHLSEHYCNYHWPTSLMYQIINCFRTEEGLFITVSFCFLFHNLAQSTLISICGIKIC